MNGLAVRTDAAFLQRKPETAIPRNKSAAVGAGKISLNGRAYTIFGGSSEIQPSKARRKRLVLGGCKQKSTSGDFFPGSSWPDHDPAPITLSPCSNPASTRLAAPVRRQGRPAGRTGIADVVALGSRAPP